MHTNIIIAAVLFLVSSAGAYVIWYIVRGRRKKLGRAAGTPAPGGREEEKPDAKDKPSRPYCYPKINDVMGFEFVTVVKVPDELLADKAEVKKSWTDTPAVGLTAVSGAEPVNDEDEIHDTTEPRDYYADGNAADAAAAYGPADPAEVEEGDISQEDINAINSISVNWGIREEEDRTFDDEAMNAIINSHPEMIEDTEHGEDDYRTARNVELERRIFGMQEDIATVEEENAGGFGSSMLDDDEQPEGESADGGAGYVDGATMPPDELPEI